MTHAPPLRPRRALRPLWSPGARGSLAAAAAPLALLAGPVETAAAEPTAPRQTPWSAYHARSAARALHERCGLLSTDVSHALSAAEDHAHAVLIRHGATPEAVRAAHARAIASAADTACDSADARALTTQVERAYDGWSLTPRARFLGLHRAWEAERVWANDTTDAPGAALAPAADRAPTRLRWLVRQDAVAGPVSAVANDAASDPSGSAVLAGSFGLIAIDEEIQLAALLVDEGAHAHTARLSLRDARRASRATVDRLRRFAPARPGGLAAAAAPEALSRAFWASERLAGRSATRLAGESAASRPAALFTFAADALAAVAQLDPSEVVIVEAEVARADARGGERVAIAFEVGDFNAARDFALRAPAAARRAP